MSQPPTPDAITAKPTLSEAEAKPPFRQGQVVSSDRTADLLKTLPALHPSKHERLK